MSKPKPKVGQVWSFSFENHSFETYYVITKIDGKTCRLNTIKNKALVNSVYPTSNFKNELWKYIGNNEKIIKVLYDK